MLPFEAKVKLGYLYMMFSSRKDKDKLKEDYDKLIDYIAQNQDDIQTMLGDILNDSDFFKNPDKVQQKIEKFIHDKKFSNTFNTLLKEK